MNFSEICGRLYLYLCMRPRQTDTSEVKLSPLHTPFDAVTNSYKMVKNCQQFACCPFGLYNESLVKVKSGGRPLLDGINHS